MKTVCFAISLAMLGGGCGAVDNTTTAQRQENRVSPNIVRWPPPPPPVCARDWCIAAGGYCDGIFCVPGCENAPINCSAVGPDITQPGVLPGFVDIHCAGTGNGVYNIYWTAAAGTTTPLGGNIPPDGPWVQYPDYHGSNVVNGTQLNLGLDEYNYNWPRGYYSYCNTADGQKGPYCFVPTYVRICAEPGTAPFTEQDGICPGNGENPPSQCVVVPVTH
jgi:hypothetical protein